MDLQRCGLLAWLILLVPTMYVAVVKQLVAGYFVALAGLLPVVELQREHVSVCRTWCIVLGVFVPCLVAGIVALVEQKNITGVVLLLQGVYGCLQGRVLLIVRARQVLLEEQFRIRLTPNSEFGRIQSV